jgi:hypothetical protein
MNLVKIGFILSFYFFIDRILIRSLISYSSMLQEKPAEEKKEFALKIFELVLSFYLLITGLSFCLFYLFLANQDLTQFNYWASINGLLIFSYFFYHSAYLMCPGKKLFLIHHLLMMALCYVVLTNHILYLYLMAAAIPSGSSVVRAWQWLAHCSPQWFKRISSNWERWLYMFFQLTPIIFIFIHFLFFNTVKVPLNLLVVLTVIGLCAAGIAIYIIKNQISSVYYVMKCRSRGD